VERPRQGEAYEWLAVEMANLRAAGGPPTMMTSIQPPSRLRGAVGTWTYLRSSPSLGQSTYSNPRPTSIGVWRSCILAAAQCHATGRIDDAVSYADASQLAIRSGYFADVPYEYGAWAGAPYLVAAGEPQRWIDLCRNLLARGPDTGGIATDLPVLSLTFGGAGDEAIAESADRRDVGSHPQSGPQIAGRGWLTGWPAVTPIPRTRCVHRRPRHRPGTGN
jgi:hypothetical protein